MQFARSVSNSGVGLMDLMRVLVGCFTVDDRLAEVLPFKYPRADNPGGRRADGATVHLSVPGCRFQMAAVDFC